MLQSPIILQNLTLFLLGGRVQDNDIRIANVTRHQILKFCSTSVYCCNIFDLFRILLLFILIVSLTC